jgi:hypothetical protein
MIRAMLVGAQDFALGRVIAFSAKNARLTVAQTRQM